MRRLHHHQLSDSNQAKTFNRLLCTRLVVVVYRFSCPSRRRNGAGFTSETTWNSRQPKMTKRIHEKQKGYRRFPNVNSTPKKQNKRRWRWMKKTAVKDNQFPQPREIIIIIITQSKKKKKRIKLRKKGKTLQTKWKRTNHDKCTTQFRREKLTVISCLEPRPYVVRYVKTTQCHWKKKR